MSFLRLHRLSVLWKNWMFNQEPEHVFQVENSKDNEESILQREVPLRQSRRRFRKINQRGERQTITDNVDASSYLSVSLLPVCHLSGSVLLGLGTLRKAVRWDEMGCACRSCGCFFWVLWSGALHVVVKIQAAVWKGVICFMGAWLSAANKS